MLFSLAYLACMHVHTCKSTFTISSLVLQVRQLEHEKEITVGTFDTRNCELMHLLACTRDDLNATRSTLEQTQLRAEAAETR